MYNILQSNTGDETSNSPVIESSNPLDFIKKTSNLILRAIGKTYGLELNNHGLHIVVHGTEGSSELVFLTNYPEIYMDFLGYDYAKFDEGTTTEDLMLGYLSNIRHSLPAKITQESIGMTVGDNKLLDRAVELLNNGVITPLIDREIFNFVFSYFPQSKSSYLKTRTRLMLRTAAEAKYNINIVKHVTGFDDEQAEIVMAKFAKQFGSVKEQHDTIIKSTDAEVRSAIAYIAIESGHPKNSLVDRAARFAASAHAYIDQRRKYDDKPYIVHPKQVAEIVSAITDDQEMIAAAWLHDVVEDVSDALPNISQSILTEFGPGVAKLVDELTDVSKNHAGSRQARKALDREHSKNASTRAKSVKLADVISNGKSIVHHDNSFTPTYINEMSLLIPLLKEGSQALFQVAEDIIITYQKAAINKVLSK